MRRFKLDGVTVFLLKSMKIVFDVFRDIFKSKQIDAITLHIV
jgi:hypothetical protein